MNITAEQQYMLTKLSNLLSLPNIEIRNSEEDAILIWRKASDGVYYIEINIEGSGIVAYLPNASSNKATWDFVFDEITETGKIITSFLGN